MNPSPVELQPHRFSIALMQPQIAPNTGNIARLCVATGTRLHLIRPLGFVLSDRKLKRSAMDYWDRLQLTVHDDDAAFFLTNGSIKLLVFYQQIEPIVLGCCNDRWRLPGLWK